MRSSAVPRVASLALLAIFVFSVQPARAQDPFGPFVKDEILVKLRKGTDRQTAGDLFARLGAAERETLGDTGWVRVRISPGADPRSAAARFVSEHDVEAAQPNFYYKLAATPNDPQWNNSGMYGLLRISAPSAWDVSTGSTSIVVANIDTGMRYTHEDLAPNMWTNPGEINGNGIDDDGNGFADDYYGYDFFFNDPNPIDEHGHGTHTGGTIGAAGNNALGVVGVNWSVKVMAIKIYDADGFGTTSAMLINAYNYIRMMKLRGVDIRVTNNSYSGCDEACGYDQATKDAIDAMGDAGILNIFAAGNNAINNDTNAAPNFPASYTSPSVLAVASSTSADTRSSFSAFGAASVDVAAPGSSILSTTAGSNSSYGLMSGTSMATPHVAGAAALIAAAHPTLSPASIKATLLNTVDTFASLGTTVQQNWANTPVRAGGRINLARAVQTPTVCSFALTADTLNLRVKGGPYTIGVAAAPNCDFAVRSNARWISIEGPQDRSGAAQVSFRVAASRKLHRAAALNIGGRVLNVTQSRTGSQ